MQLPGRMRSPLGWLLVGACGSGRSDLQPHYTLRCCAVQFVSPYWLVCLSALPRLSALTCHVPLPLLALLPKQNGRPANARIFTRSLITRPLSDRLLLPHLSASGACGLEESPALHSLSTLHHPPLPPSTTPSLRHSTYHSRTSVHLLSLCYG
jgi:hypothetical protein